jgi:hypothetical protein
VTPQEARHAGRVIASKVLDYGETAPHGLAAEVVRDLTRAVSEGAIPRELASEALRGAADHFEDVAKLTRETADEIDADKAAARAEPEAS